MGETRAERSRTVGIPERGERSCGVTPGEGNRTVGGTRGEGHGVAGETPRKAGRREHGRRRTPGRGERTLGERRRGKLSLGQLSLGEKGPEPWGRPEGRGAEPCWESRGGGGAVGRRDPPPHPHAGKKDRVPASPGQAGHHGVGAGSLPPTGEPWAKAGRRSQRGEVTVPALPGDQDLGV